jgi:ribosome-associated heat shock protein Hsp15
MSLRVDKFIWFVRLAKTRTQAAELVQKGKVKLNQQAVKSSKEIRINDVLSISKHNAMFSFRVTALPTSRLGAKFVADYLEDQTPSEEFEKYEAYRLTQQSYRQHGTGRPTKRERLAIQSFIEEFDQEME